jgi:hypothetical protein
MDSETGALWFQPEEDEFGTAMFDVVLVDDGGVEKRGHTRGRNMSAVRRLVIDVLPVNDPPSFSLASSLLVASYGGLTKFRQEHVAWNIQPGPDNEADQNVSFQVDGFEGNAKVWFASPTISSNGTFTAGISSNVSFNIVLRVSLKDDGGTSYGGRNVSETELITVLFIIYPLQVSRFSMVQKSAQGVSLTWSHEDLFQPTKIGRVGSFLILIVQDCTSLAPSTPEGLSCQEFSLSLEVDISACNVAGCVAAMQSSQFTVGSRYVASVRALNQAGPSTARNSAIIFFGSPSAPSQVSITQASSVSAPSRQSVITVTWMPPNDNGDLRMPGSPNRRELSGYSVLLSLGSQVVDVVVNSSTATWLNIKAYWAVDGASAQLVLPAVTGNVTLFRGEYFGARVYARNELFTSPSSTPVEERFIGRSVSMCCVPFALLCFR